MNDQRDEETPLAPLSGAGIDRARARCRRLVRRRAALSAGVAAVPLPGLDMLSDLATFTLLVEEVNQAFGLTPAQIGRLQPRLRVIAYEAAAALGGMLVGKIVTRELVLQVLKRSGVKLAAKSAAKVVPLAGQIASAAIGFLVFRQMGYQHVEACARVARKLAQSG